MLLFFYFYYFHTFKKITFCIEDEKISYELECKTREDCLNYAELYGVNFSKIDEFPEIIRKNAKEIIEKAVLCEGVCKVRKVRGFNIEKMEIEKIDECLQNEEKILIKIKGKDLVSLYKYYK